MILTGFQFRAARRALNLTFTQLHQNTGILRGVLTRLENTIENLEDIYCSAKDAETLLNYFNQNRLIFPDKNTIVLDADIEPKLVENNLTRFQFIVARTITKLSQRELAKNTILTHTSFQRIENNPNNHYVKIPKEGINILLPFFKKIGIHFPDNKSIVLKSNLIF